MSDEAKAAKTLTKDGVTKMMGTGGSYNYLVVGRNELGIMGVSIEVDMITDVDEDLDPILVINLRVRLAPVDDGITGYDLAKLAPQHLNMNKVAESHCSFTLPMMIPATRYKEVLKSDLAGSFLTGVQNVLPEYPIENEDVIREHFRGELLGKINQLGVKNVKPKEPKASVKEVDGVTYVDFTKKV